MNGKTGIVSTAPPETFFLDSSLFPSTEKGPAFHRSSFSFRILVVGLADGAEDFHPLLDLGLDGLVSRLEELSGIESLLVRIRSRLAGDAILDRGSGEDQLTIGVDIDLADTVGDGLADLLIGDAGSAVKDKRNVVRRGMDPLESIEVESLPIGRIDAVDVSDTGGKEVDAQSGDLGALFGVGDLAIRRDAVLGSADGTDFGLDGEALVMGKVDKLGGLLDVFVEGEMRAVEHDGRESGGDAALGPFERAVIEMEGDGNGDAEALVHRADHRGDGLEAGHVLGRAFGDTEDDRRIEFLGGGQDGLGPLQVVDVELSDGIVSVTGNLQHSASID